MKITDLKSYLIQMDWDDRTGGSEPKNTVAREFVFVQIDTDEGITGWGEITNYPGNVGNRAIQKYTSEIKDFLVGKDPTRIEEIWARTFRLFTYTGTRGATTAAMSGIDIALWDIFGKSLNLPIYKLLGGAVRESIPLYTHPPEPGLDIELARRDAKEIVASGHTAFKMDPMMHSLHGGNIGFLDGEISAEGAERAEQITAEVRDAVGPNIEILIDAHGRFNVPTAIDLANRLEPYGIHWFEEPVPVESYHALQQVRDSTNVRISVGERLHTRFEFVPIFENNLADYVMPDVTWTGGISELKKISTMAEAYYIPVSPHDASGPINIMAGAHVSATIPNFYKLETMRYELSGYNPLIDIPLDIRKGHLYLSEKPGLGINLDEEFLKAHAVPGYGDD
tara:strand:- start:1085 stop:2269 length:1185 start_codon:yes stop_codon:yes gene_type:complete